MKFIQFFIIVVLLLKDLSFENCKVHCERVKCRYMQRIDIHEKIEVSESEENGGKSKEIFEDEINKQDEKIIKTKVEDLERNSGLNFDDNSQKSLLIKIDPSQLISIKILHEKEKMSSNFEFNLEKNDGKITKEEFVSQNHQLKATSKQNQQELQNNYNLKINENFSEENDESLQKSSKFCHNCKPISQNNENFPKIQPKFDKNSKPSQNSLTNISKTENSSKFCETFISPSSLNIQDLEMMADCNDIDFSSNNLTILSITFTLKFSSLESVNFDNNSLKTLPQNLLINLINLRKFSAKNNQIESINENFFAFNFHLEFVDFSFNYFRHIPMRLFIHNQNLKFVSFKSNVCVNHEFPEITMEHLIGLFGVNCSDDRNILAFILKLIQFSSKFEAIGGDLANETSSNEESDDNEMVASTDLDVLFTGLFWLIIPIILILFTICGMICFVIYNKFIVYGVNARNNREISS